MTGLVSEAAIREVKNGDVADWTAARAPLLDGLATSKGVEADWTQRAFFTFPGLGPLQVYVGLTRWSSLAEFNAASQAMMTTPVVQSLFEKVKVQAFVQVAPADGQPFILENDINTPGQVLEVAARTPKQSQEGNNEVARGGFFGKVAERPGQIFDRDFLTTDCQRAMITGWETRSNS